VIIDSYKIFQLIPRKLKITSLILIFLFLLGSLLEIMGLGMFFPVISELTEDKVIFLDTLKFFFTQFTGLEDRKYWFNFIFCFLIFLFFIKNIILALILYYQNLYINSVTANLSSGLYEIYLKQDFLFHKINNSSKLIRNINVEIATFISLLNSILKLISESFFLFGVLVLLCFIDFKATFFILTFIIFLLIIYNFFTNKVLKKIGEIRHKSTATAIQNLQETFGSIKEIKIGFFEDLFIKSNKKIILEITKATQIFNTITQLPRLVSEFLIVLIFSIIIIFFFNNTNDYKQLFVYIGFYSIVVIKTAPCFLRIFSSIQQIHFSRSVLNTLVAQFNLKKNINEDLYKPKKVFTIKNSIILKNISFKYLNSEYAALNNVSLEIEKGQFVGVLGPSGSGKSTLMDIILGLIKPDIGDILFDDMNINDLKKLYFIKIGYVPQLTYLTDDTLANNIALGQKELNYEKINEVIKMANLHELVNKLPKKLESFVGERGEQISVGERQRVGIARALYNDPELLLLDEPTSSLDHASEIKIMETINSLRKKKTVIFITHKNTLVENFDKIIHIKNGQIQKIIKK
jgi:ABC-type multidrug transport system fused ATPase/permease subunit